jgi:hypothetical protein
MRLDHTHRCNIANPTFSLDAEQTGQHCQRNESTVSRNESTVSRNESTVSRNESTVSRNESIVNRNESTVYPLETMLCCLQ